MQINLTTEKQYTYTTDRRSKINESLLDYIKCLSDASQPTWNTMTNMHKMKENRMKRTRSQKQRYSFILFIRFSSCFII